MKKSKVYFSKEISPQSLIRIYEALGANLPGKIAVKVSTGERGAKGYLKANLIGPLVQKIGGTIVECNTAYDGARNTTADHLEVAKEHGFADFAELDIMDSEGEMKLPVKNGKHLKYDLVGKNLANYDSLLNLAHGKGHPMGGFGASLKNQAIGIASRNGKAYIHMCGESKSPEEMIERLTFEDDGRIHDGKTLQKDFIESMAEAAMAVNDYLVKQNIPAVYITVMNAISLLCDCSAEQDDPVMRDLGIVASLDPVANDQAFVDFIWQSDEPGAKELQREIERQEGRHILEYAEELGLGSREYELIEV